MKKVVMSVLGLMGLAAVSVAFAANEGIGGIASNVTSNLGAIAKLITAAAYVAGMAFVVGAIVKFKAHKDNPAQVAISIPIALLFIGAALIFVPGVFKSAGGTLLGAGASAGKSSVAGVSSF